MLLMGFNIVSASLGITPAKIDIDFKPGEKYDFSFVVISDDPNKEIELYLEGDMAEYGKVIPSKVVGTSSFRVKVNLPQSVEKPGVHSIIVRAKEAPPENQFIGSQIIIGALIKISVPFPGKYAVLSLNLKDINEGQELPVELKVDNKGKENLKINRAYVEFYTGGEKIRTLDFSLMDIGSTEEGFFRKKMDTTGLKSGNYKARAYIDAGKLFETNTSFRIGSLKVEVLNFTERLVIGGIQKYHIDIESGWNSDIGEVFADVNISNGLKNESFRTPPINLPRWERKTLEGFIDTSNLKGKYDVNLMLHYAGVNTLASGSLLIVGENYNLMIGLAIGAIVLVLVIIIYIMYKRNSKRKRRRKRK